MTTPTEMQAKVDKTVTNMDRIDDFVNGGPTETVTVDGNVTLPSMRNIATSGFRRVTVPPTSTTAGEPGNVAVSETHVYFYTGNGIVHTWARTGISTW